jgi:hypothetical protein
MGEFSNTLQALFIDLATSDFMEEMFLNLEHPERITHFVRSHTPHTPFAMVPIPLPSHSNNAIALKDGGPTSFTISRSGDYLLHTWLHLTIPAITCAANHTAAWCPKLMHSLVSRAKVTFNDMTLTSTINPNVLDAHAAFHITASKLDVYNEMIGNVPDLTGFCDTAGTIPSKELSLPLPFFWSADAGTSLPTAALPYNDIVCEFSFANIGKCLDVFDVTDPAAPVRAVADATTITGYDTLSFTPQLWAEYAIVSNGERDQMGKSARDILVDTWLEHPSQNWSAISSGSAYHSDLRLSSTVQALFISAHNTTSGVGLNRQITSRLPVSTGGATFSTQVASGDSAIGEIKLSYENTTHSHVPAQTAHRVTPYYHAPACNRGDYSGVSMLSYCLNTGSLDPVGSSNFGKLTGVTLSVTPTDAGKAAAADNNSPQTFSVDCAVLAWDVIRISGGTAGKPMCY